MRTTSTPIGRGRRLAKEGRLHGIVTDWSSHRQSHRSQSRIHRGIFIWVYSCQWLRGKQGVLSAGSLAFCCFLYNRDNKYKCGFCKDFGDLWKADLQKTFSIQYLLDTSPSLPSVSGSKGLLLSCPEPQQAHSLSVQNKHLCQCLFQHESEHVDAPICEKLGADG